MIGFIHLAPHWGCIRRGMHDGIENDSHSIEKSGCLVLGIASWVLHQAGEMYSSGDQDPKRSPERREGARGFVWCG